MRIVALSAAIWISVLAGPAHADATAMGFGDASSTASHSDGAAELVGHWGVVILRKELVRVPVLRDRPSVSAAGTGMVTRQGPLFTTVLRDEEVLMEVDFAVSLQIDSNGSFTLQTDKRRAASPTNSCQVRSGSRRAGLASYGNGKLVLRSSGGIGRSLACDEVKGPETREGERTDAYSARREGASLILTAADGEVWELRKMAG